MILPGDLVDVIGILKADLVGVDKAVTIFQNIEVLAVAQKAQEPIPPAADTTATPVPSGTLGERPSDVKANPSAKTVTLAVTEEQAQLLALVQSKGDLALSLRSFGDRATAIAAGDGPHASTALYAKTPISLGVNYGENPRCASCRSGREVPLRPEEGRQAVELRYRR